jgi:hypothetical protein
MAKATKRLSKRVTTVRQAIKAYGGELSTSGMMATVPVCRKRLRGVNR